VEDCLATVLEQGPRDLSPGLWEEVKSIGVVE
jgi:hypothetical protein